MSLRDADLINELLIDGDEVVTSFRDRYGSYTVGRLESDPEMEEYDEMVDLGQCLSGRSSGGERW